MSASLVGSEMCIRDSCRKMQETARCADSLLLTPSWLHPSLERLVGTVSYTHLTLPTICSV
eukprot:13981213-Alexandrium_andersonii.AAC.1